MNTEVGAGEAVVFGEQQNGVGFETHDAIPGEGGTLILDLEVGMGQIEVRRRSRTTGVRRASINPRRRGTRPHHTVDPRLTVATTARRGR